MTSKIISIPTPETAPPTVATVDERLQALAEDVQRIRLQQTEIEIQIAKNWATGNTADLETEFAKLAVRLLAAARVEASLQADRRQAERIQIIAEVDRLQSEFKRIKLAVNDKLPRLEKLRVDLATFSQEMEMLKQQSTDTYQMITHHFVGVMKTGGLFSTDEAHGLRLNPTSYQIPETLQTGLQDSESADSEAEAG